ncbi:hypothetical protein C8R44DRAFT_618510, partial [Mycena epipterygia]
ANDRTEYIWLDEFCLSDHNIHDDQVISTQRSIELGRLADISRNARQVSVFCHEEDCDHTGLECIWGQRLFTIPEILHTPKVLRMTRKRNGEKALAPQIFPTSGRAFREKMQSNAARGNKWHLHAIFQHTVNAGAVPWEVAIHALVVEAIRRDEAGGFNEHQYLGKALNRLLPRRARLNDLGNSGWIDLAWLLELNQDFYNAASVVAVFSLAEDDSGSWLGKPIDPVAGNERIEPVVKAFPASQFFDFLDDKEKLLSNEHRKPKPSPPLTIIGAETLGFRPKPLKRDPYGLYNNKEMNGFKFIAIGTAGTVAFFGIIFFAVGKQVVGGAICYLTAICYSLVELLVGTMYLERTGWAFLADSEWGDNLEAKLGEQDNNLRTGVRFFIYFSARG